MALLCCLDGLFDMLCTSMPMIHCTILDFVKQIQSLLIIGRASGGRIFVRFSINVRFSVFVQVGWAGGP